MMFASLVVIRPFNRAATFSHRIFCAPAKVFTLSVRAKSFAAVLLIPLLGVVGCGSIAALVFFLAYIFKTPLRIGLLELLTWEGNAIANPCSFVRMARIFEHHRSRLLKGAGFSSIFHPLQQSRLPYNNLVVVCGLVLLVTVVAVKKLSDRFLVLLNRPVLAFGMPVFTIEALWVNLSRPLNLQTPRLFGHLAFAVLLLSFGYVGVQITFDKERRLLSIEDELAVARRLQLSILPSSVPEIGDVRISVAYQPMTAVAGDFYEFIPVDQKRVGFLIADVTGHGVPAALIASMIKMATQSLVPYAPEPREVLRGLNRMLFPQLHDQLVSAAYLWLDTENCQASYAAAGHPPLLRWREGRLERIESNGLLFGVIADPDYPVRDLPIHPGDRFLLYTDGVVEPDNARGDAFGDVRLEEVLRDKQDSPPAELSDELLAEILNWQPASVTQQDDITLIVIDVA